MRHDADVLVIVVVHGVTLVAKNFHSVCISTVFDHVELGVLGVLREMLLDLQVVRLVAERERLEVVVQAEIVVGLGCIVLQLLDEPHVTICREEKLAGDLIHFMLANDATSHSIVKLLLDVFILLLGDHVHH